MKIEFIRNHEKVAATIISLTLIAAAFSALHIRHVREQCSRQRRLMAKVQERLRNYHSHVGHYPTTEKGLLWLYSLDPQMILPRRPPVPKDEWGRDYEYWSDGHTYVLRSLGPADFSMVGCKDWQIVARSP